MWIIGAVLLTLSWETNHSERKPWTTALVEAVEQHYKELDTAQDMGQFCPNYYKLDRDQRVQIWSELFVQVAYWESGWNPHSDYTEHTLGIDRVTGQPVVSSGLLQLSYGDTLWAKWCPFNWDADKKINSFQTSIHDPKNNLGCGVGIMARQVRKTGRITLDKGVYWSTLRAGSHRAKIGDVATKLQGTLKFCGKPKNL